MTADIATFDRWKEQSRRDDWHNTFVGSDIRQMLGEIDRLRAEVLQCSVELGEAVKLLAPHYPGTASMYDMACGRARVALGLTPCDADQN